MNPFLDAIVRSSVVLTIGLAGAWMLRKQPASLRHWALAAAIALAVAQPVITLVVPSMQIPAIHWTSDAAVAEPMVETDFAVGPIVPRISAPAVPRLDWARIAVITWAAGATTSLAILLFGAIWLSWLGWKSVAADDRWRREQDAVQAQLGIRTPVRLLVTDHPALLVTWGAIAPVILLPAEANQWPVDRIRLVLAHEIAHLIRRDWTIQLAAEMIRAINWFNPLFWIACARLRRESEYACDDIVLDLGIGGTSYASHLVDLARTFSVHGRTWLPAPSIARPSTLERRVRAMLNPQVNRRPVSMKRRAALAGALFAVALPIAAASQAISTPSGTVVDPTGRPLVDATLRLTPVGNSEQVFETRTDASGAFQFSPVPAGEYMLAVRYPGFSGSRQRMQLSSGGTTISLRVQVGTLQETISVTPGGGDSRYEQSAAVPVPAACTPSTTGGQIVPPMKVRDVRPRYRKEWVDAKIEGLILMQAKIGTDGAVKSVDVISPVNADLEDEAIAAVSQWRFSPTYLNCEPIEVQMYVTVQFKAQ
jgi:TonB family protein